MEKKVLVFNRIGTLRRLTVYTLQGLGFMDVDEAADLPELEEMLQGDDDYACILYEVTISELTARDHEFLDYLKKIKLIKGIPLIFSSPYSDRNLVMESLKRGADQFIIKSMDMEVFTTRLKGALESLRLMPVE
ncbi:response regulator [Fibrobacterota bacterium]